MANLKSVCNAVLALVALLSSATTLRAQEPELSASAIEQSGRQTVPTLVRFQGSMPTQSGQRISVRFSIFATEQAQEPLWSEVQTVQLGAKGEFTVMLGAGSAIGLPQSLFVDGEPRWLSIQANGNEEPRSLLTSVPYALKSADAQTLAGQPAATFVTQEELAAKLRSVPSPAALQTVLPQTAPTGSGTTGSLALWTSSSALGTSAITQTGTGTTAKIGINTVTPSAALDVNGPSFFRSNLTVHSHTATVTTAGNSPFMQISASSFQAGGAAVNQNFAWQAIATGNNTATPSSRLSLLFGTASPAQTGFSIAPNGVLTFASGQTFPGAGTITKVTAGTGLTGGGVAGAVTLNVDTTKIPQLSAFNTFTNGASFTSAAPSAAALTAKNTGTGDGLDVATGTGFAGYFSNNATFDSTVYAMNAGSGNAGNFNNNSASRVTLAATNASTDGAAISVYGTTSNGRGVYGIATTGTGVYGISTSGYGVYGTSTSGSGGTFVNLSSTQPSVYGGNESSASGAVGVYGTTPAGTGVSGNTTTGVGVDGKATGGYAVRGIATTGIGGIFSNNSTTSAAVYAYNGGAGNAGYFENNSASHVAVAGLNDSTDAQAIGTYGSVSNGYGIRGLSTAGTGAYGTSTSGTGIAGGSQSQYGAAGYSQTGIGVYGELGFPSTQFGGVTARSGVWGDAGDNGSLPTNYYPAGVIGSADDGVGGLFINKTQTYYTLIAVNEAGGSTHNFFRTFIASSPNGTCGIGGAGDLTCTGQVKSIVTTASARQVETYSVQSSENWLEDYGSGMLQNGHAIIHLDPAFLDAANAEVSYHVFLTPKGDAQTLFVTNETLSGFEVRESGHGVSSIAFDYRIVAKRRGLESERLQDVTERVHAEIEGARRMVAKPVATIAQPAN